MAGAALAGCDWAGHGMRLVYLLCGRQTHFWSDASPELTDKYFVGMNSRGMGTKDKGL